MCLQGFKEKGQNNNGSLFPCLDCTIALTLTQPSERICGKSEVFFFAIKCGSLTYP